MIDFHQFSAHSSSIKKCEIINVNGLNADVLEIISIVSFICVTDISLRASLIFTALNFRLHRTITIA